MKSLLILFLLFFTSNFDAQVLDKDKIKNNSNSRVKDFNRSRSNRDKNSLKQTNESKEEQVEGQGGGSFESIIEEDSSSTKFDSKKVYEFSSVIKYEILNFQDGIESKKTGLEFYISDSIFMLDSGDGMMIFDYKLNQSFVLNKLEKTGVLTNLMSADIYNLSQTNDMWEKMYQKTGKTKLISEILCEEYILKESQEKKLSFWTSKENVLTDCSDLAQKSIQMFLLNLGIIQINNQLFTIGMEVINSYQVLETAIYYKSFKKESSNLNLGEYKISSY